jgi:restriction endonuclease S subunit
MFALSEIATVRAGLLLARKEALSGPTPFLYESLTLRAISPNGRVDRSRLEPFYALAPLSAEYLTRRDDVVVRLNFPYSAVSIDSEEDEGLVVSSNCAIVRPDARRLSPPYLAWFLNLPEVRRRWARYSVSVALSAIAVEALRNLKIDPPPLETQAEIVRFDALARREVELLRRLADEKEKYYAEITRRMEAATR